MSSSGHNYYFVIVGRNDNPLFELEHNSRGGEKPVDNRYLAQFIAHAALDLVDEHMVTSNSMYLKNVDKFNEFHVYAFVGATVQVRFLLLHDVIKVDENAVRQFFTEMYELYCKFELNPLYEHHTPIKSSAFDKKAQTLLKKYLP